VTIVAKKLTVIGAVMLLLDVVAAAGWAASRSSHASAAGRTASSTGDASGQAGSLSLRILRSYTSRQIKNAYVPVTAKGIYVIMDVAATNNGARVATLSGGGIKLELGGVKYALASGGVQGLELAGHKTLPGATVGPGTTASGWVAFDVPPKSAASVPELCFGEAACLPAPAV
jgi:Domain of unknown function (DUF4352)